MKSKLELAAENYEHSHDLQMICENPNLNDLMEVTHNSFLAGAKHREAELMGAINKALLFLEYVSKTDVSENAPDFLWLNEWRNSRKQLAQNTLKEINKQLAELGIE